MISKFEYSSSYESTAFQKLQLRITKPSINDFFGIVDYQYLTWSWYMCCVLCFKIGKDHLHILLTIIRFLLLEESRDVRTSANNLKVFYAIELSTMSVNNDAIDDLIPYRFNDDRDDLEDITPCNEVTNTSENCYPSKVVFLLGF